LRSLYIAQKLFSLWGTYDVAREDGTIAYTIKGSPSLTRKLTIYDGNGQPVGLVHQAFLSLLPCFEIIRNGEKLGTIQQKLTLLRPKLVMNYMGWQADGNVWGWDYEVRDDAGGLVGTIQTELWHLSDHFSIHYEREEDALPLLMLVLAIDALQDSASQG